MKSTAKNQKQEFETVLVLQGGGSLGAYECGVYKTEKKMQRIHLRRFEQRKLKS